jgi:hypothetical protein
LIDADSSLVAGKPRVDQFASDTNGLETSSALTLKLGIARPSAVPVAG